MRPFHPGQKAELAQDPILIDTEMLATVRAHATDYLEVISSTAARAAGIEGMALTPMDQPAAMGIPGPAVHAEVAAASCPGVGTIVLTADVNKKGRPKGAPFLPR